MLFFKSKEEKEKEKLLKEQEELERLTKSYTDDGFVIAKAVYTMVDLYRCLFIIDTENKKFAFIEKVARKDIQKSKVYDFSDVMKYEASNGQNPGNFATSIGFGSMVANKQICMQVNLYLNTNNIDDSLIKLMDYKFASDSPAAFYMKTHQERYDNLVKCLEYIMNNK